MSVSTAACVAYSLTTLGSSMMNNIFSFYYVKLFLSSYQISESSFQQAQVVYMVWNAVNDPLFGYIQDTWGGRCCVRRRLSVLYGAPLYAISFLLPWFPWRAYRQGEALCGLQLVTSLCAFDASLTFVLLAQCALFAETSSCHAGRLKLLRYNQVASLLGSCSVLLCGLLSRNMDDFGSFQGVAVGVAMLGCCSMLYTGLYAESRFDGQVGKTSPATGMWAVLSLTRQILAQRNFQLFVIMNFFQVFMVAFCSNFTQIFAEQLIPPDALPSEARSLMYGAGFICPQLLVLASQKILHSIGYYRIILRAFSVQAGASALMFLLGPTHHYLLAVYLTSTMVLVQATFSLFNLPLADIIDADLQIYQRSSPLSSMVFGTNALFTKPAQSLAPMLVVTLLNQFGFQSLQNGGVSQDPSSEQVLRGAMFHLVCLLPLCVCVLQAVVWSPFSIRESHVEVHERSVTD